MDAVEICCSSTPFSRPSTPVVPQYDATATDGDEVTVLRPDDRVERGIGTLDHARHGIEWRPERIRQLYRLPLSNLPLPDRRHEQVTVRLAADRDRPTL
jgi:hypothetical protein